MISERIKNIKFNKHVITSTYKKTNKKASIEHQYRHFKKLKKSTFIKKYQNKYITLPLFTLIPWINDCNPVSARELIEKLTNDSQLHTLDVSTLVMGDIALLLLFPLVIYVVLKLIWEKDNKKIDNKENSVLFREKIKKIVKAPVNDTYPSIFIDPYLKDLAYSTTSNIAKTIKKAKQSCTFNYSLQDLATKHGGSETIDNSWIQKILKEINNNEIKDDKDLEALLMESVEYMSNDKFCWLMTQNVAQKATLEQLKNLTVQLVEKQKKDKESQ